MEIQRADHCLLCENHFISKGVRCRLTGKLPVFNNSCELFKSGINLNNKILESYTNFLGLKKKYWLVIAEFVLILILGLAFVIFGLYSLGFMKGYSPNPSTVAAPAIPIILIGVGLMTILASVKLLTDYLKKYKNSKDEFERDSFLVESYVGSFYFIQSRKNRHGLFADDFEVVFEEDQ